MKWAILKRYPQTSDVIRDACKPNKSIDVASGLNKQKEEAKGLVGKFKEDVKDLKSAWAKNLNIESMMSFASPEEIIAYQNRKVELENEVQRRIRIVFMICVGGRYLSDLF